MDPEKTREQALQQTEEALAEQQDAADKHLIEQVKALDEVKEAVNTLQERKQSWEQHGDHPVHSTLDDVINDLETLGDELETRCIEQSKDVMPNTHAVLGDLLDCRVLAYAGSLEELAQTPSSTIQVFGAEKAMFRYLQGRGGMPKHGVLYHHPNVHSLPEEKRGAMARFIANKTSIAARLDYYGEKNREEELQQAVEERYNELENQ